MMAASQLRLWHVRLDGGYKGQSRRAPEIAKIAIDPDLHRATATPQE